MQHKNPNPKPTPSTPHRSLWARLPLVRRAVLRHPLVQMALLGLFWLAGEALVRALGLPLPGGVLGLALVFFLLISRRMSLLSMRRGANWFLGEMLLFFVPAVPALLEHREFLGWLGLKVLAVIVLGTLTVMVVTALVVDLCGRLALPREQR